MANARITRPPFLAIRETLTRTTAGKIRTAYLPPKAGRVNAGLVAIDILNLAFC